MAPRPRGLLFGILDAWPCLGSHGTIKCSQVGLVEFRSQGRGLGVQTEERWFTSPQDAAMAAERFGRRFLCLLLTQLWHVSACFSDVLCGTIHKHRVSGMLVNVAKQSPNRAYWRLTSAEPIFSRILGACRIQATPDLFDVIARPHGDLQILPPICGTHFTTFKKSATKCKRCLQEQRASHATMPKTSLRPLSSIHKVCCNHILLVIGSNHSNVVQAVFREVKVSIFPRQTQALSTKQSML